MGKGYSLMIILNVYPPDPKLIAALSKPQQDDFIIMSPSMISNGGNNEEQKNNFQSVLVPRNANFLEQRKDSNSQQ